MIKKLKFMKLIKIASDAGVVTRRYPYQPALVTPEFRGKIEIDPERCWGCAACVNVCPPNALELVEENGLRSIRYFIGRCIFCWMCVDVCPTGAIKATREFELASLDIESLREDVVHELMKCEVCGKPFAPTAMILKIGRRLGDHASYVRLCPECRSREAIKRIAR